MDIKLYSVDDSIDEFFAAHTPVTRQQCDEYASSLAGGHVSPVDFQGCLSYTVMAGEENSKIIQFRAPRSDFDRTLLTTARRVHPHFVPQWTFHGLFRGLLPVYEMEKAVGMPCTIVALKKCYDTESLHYVAVNDFARFFAEAWNNRQSLSPSTANAIYCDYKWRFDLLSEKLPQAFQKNLILVREGLDLLFNEAYPLTLNHGDLSGLNILVDPKNGHITGIIDWAEAVISPFGMSLWGLENLLGFMDGGGWHYYPYSDALRALFWDTFDLAVGDLSPGEKQAIQTARMAGLFLHYGFAWEVDGRAPVTEGRVSFTYLTAFCAVE